MKKLRYLILVLEVLMVLFSTITPTFAYKYNTKLSDKERQKDVASWIQGTCPPDNSLINPNSGTSDTIGGGACSHFAMSYALVKMGILNPANGDTPITHIKNARKHNAFLTDWGYFNFSRVKELYPDVTYVGRDDNVGGLSAEKGLTYVKGKMKEGYYVIGIVKCSLTSGHCIFFDGINEDGTTSIGDSGFAGITWEDLYAKENAYFSYLELLKCKGKDFNSQPSIYSEHKLRTTTKKEVKEYKKLKMEYDLTGMPKQSNLTEGIVKPELKGIDSLNQQELSVVESIKYTKDANKLSLFSIAKIIISLVGFVLILYSIFLIVAFIFDRFNSFFSFSLVGLLTFGHMKIVTGKEKYELDDNLKKKGYITLSKLIIIAIILLILGCMMVSGTISQWIYNLVKGVL